MNDEEKQTGEGGPQRAFAGPSVWSRDGKRRFTRDPSVLADLRRTGKRTWALEMLSQLARNCGSRCLCFLESGDRVCKA